MRMQRLEEIATGSDSFIDCYVSTDASEVAECLTEGLGYEELNGVQRQSLRDIYSDLSPDSFGSFQGEGVEIDVADIPTIEGANKRKEFGFMSMSKMRIYPNGRRDVLPILVNLLNELLAERQNVAFERGERTYVRLSKYYC